MLFSVFEALKVISLWTEYRYVQNELYSWESNRDCHKMYRGCKNNEQLYYKRYKLLKLSILSAMIKISNHKQNDQTVKWVVHVSPTNGKRAGFICSPFIYKQRLKKSGFILYIHHFMPVQRWINYKAK